MYIIAIVVLVIILGGFYNKNEITNRKVLSSLKNIPANYNVTDAISDNNLVDYYGIITNLNLLYDFVNDCEAGKTSELTFTSCNDLNEIVIKTALYKGGNIYVNIDNTRTSNENKHIKTYKFNNFELVNDEDKIALILSNNKEEITFFNYDKSVDESK